MNLLDLPNEILHGITDFCYPQELLALGETCQQFRRLLERPLKNLRDHLQQSSETYDVGVGRRLHWKHNGVFVRIALRWQENPETLAYLRKIRRLQRAERERLDFFDKLVDPHLSSTSHGAEMAGVLPSSFPNAATSEDVENHSNLDDDDYRDYRRLASVVRKTLMTNVSHSLPLLLGALRSVSCLELHLSDRQCDFLDGILNATGTRDTSDSSRSTSGLLEQVKKATLFALPIGKQAPTFSDQDLKVEGEITTLKLLWRIPSLRTLQACNIIAPNLTILNERYRMSNVTKLIFKRCAFRIPELVIMIRKWGVLHEFTYDLCEPKQLIRSCHIERDQKGRPILDSVWNVDAIVEALELHARTLKVLDLSSDMRPATVNPENELRTWRSQWYLKREFIELRILCLNVLDMPTYRWDHPIRRIDIMEFMPRNLKKLVIGGPRLTRLDFFDMFDTHTRKARRGETTLTCIEFDRTPEISHDELRKIGYKSSQRGPFDRITTPQNAKEMEMLWRWPDTTGCEMIVGPEGS